MKNLSRRKKRSLSLLSLTMFAMSIVVMLHAHSSPAYGSDSVEKKKGKEAEYVFSFTPSGRFKIEGLPPFADAKAHGRAKLSTEQHKKNQQAVMEYVRKLRQSRTAISKKETVAIYHLAEDFSVVHSLLESGDGITNAESKLIGNGRREFHQEVLRNLTKKGIAGKRLGINDFGSSKATVNAKTDTDFTMYSSKKGITGEQLVAAYKAEFKAVTVKYGHGLRPGQTDIVAHKFEATIPDWRAERSTGEFVIKLKEGIAQLRRNPEAYFLEAAYLLQVMGRSVKPGGAKTFSWLEVDKSGKVVETPRHAAEIPEFFYTPEARKRYAWGSAVANWHFYNAHHTDKLALAKYLLRSFDDGRKLVSDRLARSEEYIKLSAQQRKALVRDLYSKSFKAKNLDLIQATLDTAANMRRLKDKYKGKVNLRDLAGKLEAYRPILEYEHRLNKQNGGKKVSDAELLTLAIGRYERTSGRLLINNNIETARYRLNDWLSPDIPEGKIYVFESVDTPRVLRINSKIVERLNWSAYFEIKLALSILTKEQIRRIKDTNPNYHNDIAIVERIIEAERKMMEAPETLRPEEVLSLRKKAALMARKNLRLFRNILEQKGLIKGLGTTSKILWNRGQQFDHKMQMLLMDKAVVVAQLGKYLPQIVRYRNAVSAYQEAKGRRFDPASYKGDKETVFSPKMTVRLARTASLVEIAKTYFREGELNSTVFWATARELLYHTPFFGTLYIVEEGGWSAVGGLVLIAFVPGYGQLQVVTHLVKASVELAGMIIFEPLKRDGILMAYQGYLEPQAGGIILPGIKRRQPSPRPALLPIGSGGEDALNERRGMLYKLIKKKAMSALRKDPVYSNSPEKFPDIWYGPEKLAYQQVHQEYIEKYFGYVLKAIDRYVEDWWIGIGDFSDCDVCTIIKSQDIRTELKELIRQDYTIGEQFVTEQEANRKNEQESELATEISEVIGMDIDIDEAGKGRSEDFVLAGQAVMGHALRGMPKLPPSMEIYISPRIREVDHPDPKEDPEKKIDVIDQLGLRATVNASLEEYPGPWKISWQVTPVGGGAVYFEEGESDQIKKGDGYFSDGGTVKVTAVAFDADNRKIASATVDIKIDKKRIEVSDKDEKDEEGDGEPGSGDGDEQPGEPEGPVEPEEPVEPEQPKEEPEDEEKERCEGARETAEDIQSEIETITTDLDRINEEIEDIKETQKEIKDKLKEAKQLADDTYKAAGVVVAIKQKFEKFKSKICQTAEKVKKAKAGTERKRILNKLKKAFDIFNKDQETAREALDKAEKASSKAAAIFKKYQNFPKEVESKKKGIEEIKSKIETIQTTVREISETVTTPAGRSSSTNSSETGEVEECNKEVTSIIQTIEKDVSGLNTKIKSVESEIKTVTVSDNDKRLIGEMENAKKEAKASADTAEVYYDAILDLTAQARKCYEDAKKIAEEEKTGSGTIPPVVTTEAPEWVRMGTRNNPNGYPNNFGETKANDTSVDKYSASGSILRNDYKWINHRLGALKDVTFTFELKNFPKTIKAGVPVTFTLEGKKANNIGKPSAESRAAVIRIPDPENKNDTRDDYLNEALKVGPETEELTKPINFTPSGDMPDKFEVHFHMGKRAAYVVWDYSKRGTPAGPASDVTPPGGPGGPGVIPPGTVPPAVEPDKPINPDSLHPTQPDVATKIREWISIAKPPINVTEGANVRYTNRGNAAGTVKGGVIKSTHDERAAFDPVFSWQNMRNLDSVDHCTLEEYVVATLQDQSIEHCRGRYKALDKLTEMKKSEAKDKLEKAGLNYELFDSDKPAPSKELERTIESHDPGPNSVIKRGDTVMLYIYGSYILPKIKVPDVIDEPKKRAKQIIMDAGLDIEFIVGTPASSEEQEKTIESQSPRPGKELKQGETVELTFYGKYKPARPKPKLKRKPTPEEKVASLNCLRYGKAEAYWHKGEQKAKCKCLSGYKWNGKTCAPTKETLVRNYDCSYVNSYAKWDDSENEPRCFCKPGYVWNQNKTDCMPILTTKQEYCNQQWRGSVPQWNSRDKKWECFCPQGQVWDKGSNRCDKRKGGAGRSRSVFADGILGYNTGTKAPEGPFRNPKEALGSPNWDGKNFGRGFVSLGCGGTITLRFSSGNNMNVERIRVHEIGSAVEATRVDVNTGRGWLFVGKVGGSVDSVALRPPKPVFAVKLTDLKGTCGMRTPGADIDAVELIGR